MMEPAGPPADESEVFIELRLLVRAAIGDATRAAIGVLVAHLRKNAPQPDGATDTATENQSKRLAAASLLWENISQRIQRAQDEFDRQVTARIATNQGQHLGSAERRYDPWATGLIESLSLSIRDCQPGAYAQFVAGLQTISPSAWQTESANPMAAQVSSRAFIAAAGDVLRDRLVTDVFDEQLVDKLGVVLGEVYLVARDFLAVTIRTPQTLTLPIGYDEAEQGAVALGDSEQGPAQETMAAQSERQLAGDAPNAADESREVSASYAEHAQRADRAGRGLGVSALADLPDGPNLSNVTTLQPVAEMERDAVAFAHSIGEIPYSRASRRRYFDGVRSRLSAANTMATQLALVDLVAAMFDYVVDDRRLPEAAKPLIWRLQQPALLLTLLDPAYLGEQPRSIRRLVESFGAIANSFGEDLTRGSELYRRLETIVRAIEIVSSVLHLRAAVLSAQVLKEYRRSASNMMQLVERVDRERSALESTPGRRNRRDYSSRPGRDEERLVTDRLTQSLNQKMAQHKVPDSVRQFLEHVWLRHMRTGLLRDGDDSVEYRTATAVLDNLLWSLNGAGPTPTRRELAQRIPGIIESLTRGMRQIGAREEDHQAFFDELFLIHLKKLQRRRPRKTGAGKGSAAARKVRNARPDTLPGATMYDVGQAVPVLDEAMDLDDTGTNEISGALTSEDSALSGSGLDDAVGSTQIATQDAERDSAQTPEADDRPAVGERGAHIDFDSDIKTDEHSEGMTTVPPQSLPRSTVKSTLEPLIELPAHTHTDVSTAMMTTRVASPTTEIVAPESTAASNDDTLPDNELLITLSETDLSDLPSRPRYLRGDPATLMLDANVGTWLEYRLGSGQFAYLKIAWINRRRTVVMMLRHSDARALSKSLGEVQEFLRAGRIRILRSERSARVKPRVKPPAKR